MLRQFLARVPARSAGRRLKIESLEARQVLSGTDPTPDPMRFETFASDQELADYLRTDAVERYRDLFGQPGGWWWGGPIDIAGPMAMGGVEGVQRDHSQTNTQVEGVDEGDIVETDGDFIYILRNQELVIVDAWPAEEMHVAARVPLTGSPFAQYRTGDRLTILSYDWRNEPGPLSSGGETASLRPIMVGSGFTSITTLDVSNPESPTRVFSTELEGNYSSSRAIGDTLYVVSTSGFVLPQPRLHCTEIEPDPDAGGDGGAAGNGGVVGGGVAGGDAVGRLWYPWWQQDCRYESQADYLAWVTGHELELGVPQWSGRDAEGTTSSGNISDPTDIYKPSNKNDTTLVSVTAIDMGGDDPAPVASTSIPSTYTTTLYASADAMYLLNPDWGINWNEGVQTSILKVDLSFEDGIALQAAGRVPGQVLNQFSADEYNGYLRIATTQGWGAEAINSVFVLQQSGTTLNTVGSATGLAPGERIFSARFLGDRGFVVTFRQVDPLFALDLSSPTNPHVVGELKIPGFSNYLHPADASHLIGIGRDADLAGRVLGLQVSLFDVADLSDPRRTGQYTIGGDAWAWSEAVHDHHAVGYYADQHVLAIPVNNGSGWTPIDRDGDGITDVWASRPHTEMWVFRIDTGPTLGPRAPIQLLGKIEHEGYIRRSVRIENVLYAISDNTVTAHDIFDPAHKLGAAHFGQEQVGLPIFQPDHADPQVALAMATPSLAPPVVAGVSLGSTAWSRAFVNDLETNGLTATGSSTGTGDPATMDMLTWSGINQIKIVFSEDTLVTQNDLLVNGISVASYGVTGFQYDSGTRTAIWTVAQAFAADHITVQLSDAVRDLAGNRLDGNADGVAGQMFKYTFSTLAGDVNHSGTVDHSDLRQVMTQLFTSIGSPNYNRTADLDGDGFVTIRDAVELRNRIGSILPASPAASIDTAAIDAALTDSTDESTRPTRPRAARAVRTSIVAARRPVTEPVERTDPPPATTPLAANSRARRPRATSPTAPGT